MDPNRHLHFVSDFPHLIKCLRNGFLKTGFQTPDGRVSIIELNHPQHLGSGLDWVKIYNIYFLCFFQAAKEHVIEIWKCDSGSLTLKAMPRLSRCHLFPNAFEKMRVNLAFQLFSDDVLRGLLLYGDHLRDVYGNCDATVQFMQMISSLIKAMTTRCRLDALRQVQICNSYLGDMQLQCFILYIIPFLIDMRQKS